MKPPTPRAADWFQLVKTAVVAWKDDYAPSMGAALAYYTVFSLAPLLLIVISVAGLVFGAEAARGEIFSELRSMMGPAAAGAIEQMLASIRRPSDSLTAAAIGTAALLIGASTVFGELQDALDRIWRAPARGHSGLWTVLRTRLLSFGMILGVAFLLMVSLVAGAAVAALGKWWGGFFSGWETTLQLINAVVGFGLSTLVFAMIYKLMPRVKVRWHDVWLGALVTSGLFTIGKFLIGLYIGKSGIASGFGAAGSIAIVFVWVYYSAQIFLLGAEFTWVYARTFGSRREQPAPSVAEAIVAEVPSRAALQRQAGAEADAAVAAAAAGVAAAPPAPARPPATTVGLLLSALAAATVGVGLRLIVPRLLRRR